MAALQATLPTALPLAAPLSEAFFVVMHDYLDEVDLDGLPDLFAKFEAARFTRVRNVRLGLGGSEATRARGHRRVRGRAGHVYIRAGRPAGIVPYPAVGFGKGCFARVLLCSSVYRLLYAEEAPIPWHMGGGARPT